MTTNRVVAVRSRSANACAKVNLALHVVGQRSDGYHLLDSLVVFIPDASDHLTLEEAGSLQDELTVEGPFAFSLRDSSDNLILKAVRFARERLAGYGLNLPALRVRLVKRLPVAAGIGGGSADAAAILRLILKAVAEVDDESATRTILEEADRLGADVPVCLHGRPVRMTGIGEKLSPIPVLPDLPILLVNPNIPVATPAVFQRLRTCENPPLPAWPNEGWNSVESFARYLEACRNDLEAGAISLCPQIEEAVKALWASGAIVARMSGSGATVFGLFPNMALRDEAREMIRAARPDWWTSGDDAASAWDRHQHAKEGHAL